MVQNMFIFDRINSIGVMNNLKKKNIRKAIRYFFIREWIINTNFSITDYTEDVSTYVKDYVNMWIANKPATLKEDIKKQMTILKTYKMVGNKYSFLTYLTCQLDYAYLLKNISYLQFSDSFSNIDKNVNEILEELNNLSNSLDIVFNNITNNEVLYVFADVLINSKFKNRLFDNLNNLTFNSFTADNSRFIQDNAVVETGVGLEGFVHHALNGTWNITNPLIARDGIKTASGRIKFKFPLINYKHGFHCSFKLKPEVQTNTDVILFAFPNINSTSAIDKDLFTITLHESNTGVLKIKCNSDIITELNLNLINTGVSYTDLINKSLKIVWNNDFKILIDDTQLYQVPIRWRIDILTSVQESELLPNMLSPEFTIGSTTSNDWSSKSYNGVIGDLQIGYFKYEDATPRYDSVDSYTIDARNIVLNTLLYKNFSRNLETNRYEKLFLQILRIDNINEVMYKVRNYIANLFFGIFLINRDEKYKFVNELEKDLTYYACDVLIEEVFKYALTQYSTINKYINLIESYKSEITTTVFFSKINIGNESANNLSAIFEVGKIAQIYQKHNSDFTTQSEVFNIVLLNMKNLYLDIPTLIQANFEKRYIPEVLDNNIHEYVMYLIWKEWLSSTSTNNSAIAEDTNHLVPLELSTSDSILNIIKQQFNIDFFNDASNITLTNAKIKSTYLTESIKKKNIKNSPFAKQKEMLKDIIDARLKSFKYVRYTLRGLTEYEQYVILNYRYKTNLISSLTQEKINEFALALNRFYDSI